MAKRGRVNCVCWTYLRSLEEKNVENIAILNSVFVVYLKSVGFKIIELGSMCSIPNFFIADSPNKSLKAV